MSTILVADDHPLNRHFLATLLSYHGHEIVEAADGVEALESVRKRHFDLAIVDVAMPLMDGFTFVKALRADPELAQIPIVFYTASYRELESRSIARAAGVEHVITKPSDPEVILATVQAALGRPVLALSRQGRHASTDAATQYIQRLQVTSIMMSALIELGLELHSERDPDRLMRTACRAIRAMFASDYSVIALPGEGQRITSWVEGLVDQTRLEKLLAQEAPPPSVRNVSVRSDPLLQTMTDAMPGVSALLLLPMYSGRRSLHGWILLGRTGKDSPYSTDDERLALAAAGQVRAAHENLTSYRALRQQSAALSREQDDLEGKIDERTSELRMTNDALRREIVRREDSEEDLRTSREDLAALFEASPVSIIAFDQNGIVLSWNAAAERIFGWRAAEVIGRKSPTVPADLEDQNARLVEQTLTGTTHSDVGSQGIRKDGTRIDVSISMAPLRDAAGVPRGYVSIVSDITDRSRSEAELRSSRERLRALSARVLLIQEEERTRIARELHDDLAQLLTAIKIDVSRLVQDVSRAAAPPARVLEGVVPLIDTTLDTVGRIVSELRPSRIGEMGLAAAIEKKLVEFQERTEIECELSIRPEELNIPAPVATAVFRILEEALTNIVRHSAATRAEVRLRQQENELLLEVRDNGRGIREEELLAQDSHGVIGMKERADLLGGSLTITGIPGRGTIVAARIPLDGQYGSNSSTHR